MPSIRNPNRTPLFRLLTVATAGIGGFALGFWALRAGYGTNLSGMSVDGVSAMVAGLCALAAAIASLSFFAGVDESVGYVYSETHVDKLTGLHARIAMVGKVAEASSRALRTGKPIFLIDIDIDRFKPVNEAIGYQAGDELIRLMSERLRRTLPKRAQIGRIGAGEFAVLLADGPDLEDFEDFMSRLIAVLAEPYQLSTHQQSINVAMGVVAMPQDGSDPAQLLRRSNLALQNARTGGIGNWAVYCPEMGQVADNRQWIESEFNGAFERGDFDLHYQPQMELSEGRIIGYEALLRWNHPERGMIPPAEFIPVAEETGVIGPLGNWVLRRACMDARKLPQDCFVAVNISPVQFMTRDFITLVRGIIAETGMDVSRLELEVTETAMMQDKERAAAILAELQAMGISVAVDDFGTGYSNLSYLLDFPFRKLKIDRSFVSRLETDPSGGAVVSTIVGLSRALGVETIAEGVETQEQAVLLRAAGCDVVQGYLYGRPGPLDISEIDVSEFEEVSDAA